MRSYPFFLCLLFFYACNDAGGLYSEHIVHINKDVIIRQRLDNNKHVVSESRLIRLKDSFVKDGYTKEFSHDGRLMSLSFYKNGLRDSVSYEYANHGKVRFKHYYWLEHLWGPQYEFYDNGNIRKVDFFANDSLCYFEAFGSKEGTITSMAGKPIYVILPRNKDSFNKQEPVQLITILPILPKLKTAIEIKILAIDLKKRIVFHDTSTKFMFVDNSYSYVFEQLLPVGKYRYVANVTVTDSQTNNPVKLDTYEFGFVVNK